MFLHSWNFCFNGRDPGRGLGLAALGEMNSVWGHIKFEVPIKYLMGGMI